MRVLQLTPRIAWPPTDGGRVVMLHVARALDRLGANVEVLSLNPRKQRVSVDDAREALAPVLLDAVDVDTGAHAAAFVRSLALRVPQLVARFHSPAFESLLRERLRARVFDIVQIESPFLLPYVHAIRESSHAKIVLRSLNVEFHIWERLASQAETPLRRVAYATIARSLRRYEIAQLDACDAIVPITEVDAREFRALGCTRPMHVLPGGVDPVRIERDPIPNTAGFLGSLDYRPNQEAALWIAEELRPRLSDAIEVRIAGSRAPEWLRARLGALYAGEVPDASAFLGSLRVVLAPIFAGGGMRIKILEAMAHARAVVSTTVGAEGIEIANGENIVIADDAETFARAVEELIAHPERAQMIGEAARALVERDHSTDALVRGLLGFYEELTKR